MKDLVSTSSAAGHPPSALTLLLRINLRQTRRKAVAACRQSRWLLGFIVAFVLGYLAIAFLFFYWGFRFVDKFPGLGTLLIERLLFLLFAFLFFLLLFSNLIIAYTNLFRNPETRFLLTLPVSFRTIFQWKFFESVFLASWAFVFLVLPFLAAYGINREVGLDFYPAALAMMAIFIVLPGSVGAWVAINLARYMDRRSFQLALAGLTVLILAGGIYWLQPEYVSDESLEYRVMAVMDRLMAKTDFAQAPFLPSYWLSSGLLFWGEGAMKSAVFFILVLLSYVLFFGYLVCTRLGRAFYAAHSEVQSREGVLGRWWWLGQIRKQDGDGRSWNEARGLERWLARWMWWLREDTRALLVKDMRLFWRDTSQWGQSLILFGLLGVYIINLRQFSQQLTNPFWVHLIAFMNLMACSLNLATLTTRFVYPQFSLEGKRLWILGMAPMGMPQAVLAKFWLAFVTSLLITLSLVGLSCLMLGLPLDRLFYFVFAITVMTFTLTGLAVGVGVLYPNFKEDNPGKIVSGFGGTLCLVASFIYIVAAVILLAMGSPQGLGAHPQFGRLAGFLAAFLGLSFGLGWLPLRMGLQRVRKFEFSSEVPSFE